MSVETVRDQLGTPGVIEWRLGQVRSQLELDLKTKEICVICAMAAQDLPGVPARQVGQGAGGRIDGIGQ